MATVQQQAEAVLNNDALRNAINILKVNDVAGGLERMTNLDLAEFIADKSAVIEEAQLQIMAASATLQGRMRKV